MKSSAQAPRLAVFKFASCDGCQLSLLDLEDDLLTLAGAVDIAFFPEASSRMKKGPYEVGLVEGSITTHQDAGRILQIRRQCKTLVTIGACATAGGIQALRNWNDTAQWVAQIYPKPAYVRTLSTSTAIAQHVPVDYEIRGCPVNKRQLAEFLCALLAKRRPNIPTYSVCLECKRRGNACIAVTEGAGCLGPVTQAGCGAICPAYARGCYGCFGPMETPSAATLASYMQSQGTGADAVQRAFRSFHIFAWPNRQAADGPGDERKSQP